MKVMDAYRSAVSNRITAAIDSAAPFVDNPIAGQLLEDFLSPARAMSGSGKRTRALLVAAGWECASHNSELPIRAGAAVELYQASALVHDDIIDESDTRRGMPASHRTFETQHSERHLEGEPDSFGLKSGILLGDFLLSLSATEMENAEHVSDTAHARGRRIFHTMTTEVAFGQFLDMRAEFTPLHSDSTSAIEQALLVLRHKSARYSVEVPLLIGGALGGADDDLLDVLGRVGRPLGEAFQLRDDDLGIFGDPDVTGKPAGGDITEGKRTVLLALTRERASTTDRSVIDSLLGRELTPANVSDIRDIIDRSGARAEHERMIDERESQAWAAFDGAGIDSEILSGVMKKLAARQA